MAKVATILLAAGDSTRMGADKALLRFGDRNVIEELSARALDAGSDFVRVCVSNDVAQRLECATPHTRILVVPENLRSRGPIASIRHGLTVEIDADEEARTHSVGAWLLWPVDHPFVHVETLRALSTAAVRPVRAPICDARRGHPVVIEESERLALLAATAHPDTTLRDFMRAKRAQVQEVRVSDEAIHWNCDDRERFEQGYDHFVSK